MSSGHAHSIQDGQVQGRGHVVWAILSLGNQWHVHPGRANEHEWPLGPSQPFDTTFSIEGFPIKEEPFEPARKVDCFRHFYCLLPFVAHYIEDTSPLFPSPLSVRRNRRLGTHLATNNRRQKDCERWG